MATQESNDKRDQLQAPAKRSPEQQPWSEARDHNTDLLLKAFKLLLDERHEAEESRESDER